MSASSWDQIPTSAWFIHVKEFVRTHQWRYFMHGFIMLYGYIWRSPRNLPALGLGELHNTPACLNGAHGKHSEGFHIGQPMWTTRDLSWFLAISWLDIQPVPNEDGTVRFYSTLWFLRDNSKGEGVDLLFPPALPHFLHFLTWMTSGNERWYIYTVYTITPSKKTQNTLEPNKQGLDWQSACEIISKRRGLISWFIYPSAVSYVYVVG